MIDLKTLAREILSLTFEEGDAGVWWASYTYFPNAEAEIEALIRRRLLEILPDPREVLLSDEFLRKFAAAFADTPIPCRLETPHPTRVEFDPAVSVTSTEDTEHYEPKGDYA